MCFSQPEIQRAEEPQGPEEGAEALALQGDQSTSARQTARSSIAGATGASGGNAPTR